MRSERCAEPCAQQDRLLFGAQDEHGCSFLAHVEIFLVSEVLGALTPDQVLDTKFFTRSRTNATAGATAVERGLISVEEPDGIPPIRTTFK